MTRAEKKTMCKLYSKLIQDRNELNEVISAVRELLNDDTIRDFNKRLKQMQKQVKNNEEVELW